MKILSFAATVFLSFYGLGQTSESEILAARSEHQASLKDSSTTILDSLEYANFKGLDYFDFNSNFQLTARFEKKRGKKFEMPTSTDRLPIYRRYGYVYFTVDSTEHRLTVYQNVELTKKEGFKDYLFIPFRDETTREQTYGGGRYLDVRIPDGKEMIVDFNLAYNPYCAYSHHYSCPIPPTENDLKVRIEAGEKIPLAH